MPSDRRPICDGIYPVKTTFYWIGQTMMNEITNVSATATVAVESDTDSTLVRLWLHGRSPTTILNYRLEAERFRAFVAKPLAQVTLAELQAFSDSLEASGLQPPTRRRALAAVKSLYTFGHRLGRCHTTPLGR
jgi:site-specific recombinase XerC